MGGVVRRKLLITLPYSNCIFLSPPCNRGKKLDETLGLHEFLREYEDLQDWMAQQKQAASSEDYGNDYEHVLVSFLSNQSKINQIVCCQTVKRFQKIVPENLEDEDEKHNIESMNHGEIGIEKD